MRKPRGRGDYDRRLYFYKAVVAQDSSGALTRSWPAEADFFAKRWAQSVEVPPSILRDERFESDQWVAKAWRGYRIPFDAVFFATLKSSDSFRFRDSNSTYYDIMTVAELPDTRRSVIDILGYCRTDGSPVIP